jgi:hypothetical protein
MPDFDSFFQKLGQIPVPTRQKAPPTPQTVPSGIPPRTTKPIATTPTVVPALATDSSAIRDMKLAMQELADAVARDLTARTMPARPDKVSPGLASPDVMKAKQSFNNFVLELHAGTLPPEERHDVNEIMKTLQSLQSGSKMFRVDGVWDTTKPNDPTTQALRNIAAFIGGLLNLESVGFSGKQAYYTHEQWQKFRDFIDAIQDNVLRIPPPEVKESWAQAITSHLKGMTRLYNFYFRDQFLRHAELRPLIEGGRPFEMYDAPLTDVERQAIDAGATIMIEIPGVGPKTFPLRVLEAPADFARFLQRIGFTGNPQKALQSIELQLRKSK